MSKHLIVPVVMAGGSGTRLWPVSRQSYPKQFASLNGDETLFRSAVRRMSGETPHLQFLPPVILTGQSFRFIVMEQLGLEGVAPGAVLIEPSVRNTAPAILAAAMHLMTSDPDAIMLVAPSDHIMSDIDAFHDAVNLAVEAVLDGDFVTFGINPTYPETGYGYLELAEPYSPHHRSVKLQSFVEKPNVERAREMVEAGKYLWNAGVFLFRARDLVRAYEQYAVDVVEPVRQALANAHEDLDFLKLEPEAWGAAPNISVDYAIMERVPNLSVVPYNGKWSDLGGWDSVWREGSPDENGVVLSGSASAIDCKDTLLRSDSEGVTVVGVGLDNIIAVAMNDAVLVADKSRSQSVKQVVDLLKSKNIAQAVSFPKDHRPWGWYESLVVGTRFQVKRITVVPGGSLSLQSHFHRAEHWIIVEGTARVTVDDEVTLISENQSVYVPLGATHRMENPGKIPLVFIEVQTGSYVGEDDIVRYEDRYSRN